MNLRVKEEGAQEGVVPAAAVCLVNAARVCQNAIIHELKIATLRRFEVVSLPTMRDAAAAWR